jgi:phage shock protein A
MEQNPDDIRGMPASDAREYILGFITTLKLNEKKLSALKDERGKWENRVRLAQNSGSEDLSAQAESVCLNIGNRIQSLEAENAGLKTRIRSMTGQVPGLAARERSIDPDMLEQELLLAAGLGPGLPEDRKFAVLEQEEAAESALRELKQKIKPVSPDDEA